MSELTEEEYEAHYIRRQDLKGFLWLDAKYLNPFFTRRLTQEVGRRRTGAGWAGAAHVLGRVGASFPRLSLLPRLEGWVDQWGRASAVSPLLPCLVLVQ